MQLAVSTTSSGSFAAAALIAEMLCGPNIPSCKILVPLKQARANLRFLAESRPPSLTPEQQKEATRRRAEGATLQELADSYDRSISTMRRATRAA